MRFDEFFVFLAVVASIVYFFKLFFEFLLRRNLINKNLVDEKVKHLFDTRQKPHHTLSALKWGLTLIGLGAGLYTGMMIGYGRREDFQVAMIFSCMFMFAGAGLMLYYVIASFIEKKNKS